MFALFRLSESSPDYCDLSKWPCNDMSHLPQHSWGAWTTTNGQKCCSKTLCTCSNSSWLIASSFSMSFLLSDCKLHGHKLAELGRHKKQLSHRMHCPPACIAGVISRHDIYSFSHITPQQPTSLIFAISTSSCSGQSPSSSLRIALSSHLHSAIFLLQSKRRKRTATAQLTLFNSCGILTI